MLRGNALRLAKTFFVCFPVHFVVFFTDFFSFSEQVWGMLKCLRQVISEYRRKFTFI